MLRVFSLTALIMAATPALAQNPQPTTPQNPTVPMARSAAHGNLSDQLAKHNGTIKPPEVDPGMTVKPPPNTAATTPVIPPPGSPGGNKSVVPK